MKPNNSFRIPDQKDNKVSTEQFLITMSNKENAVIKFINQRQQIKSQKIISLHIINDRQLLNLFYAQLDRIKDYLIRRYELKSQLDIDKYIQIKEKNDHNHCIIKINTKYWEYPTLQAFLQRQSINPNEEMERDRTTLMHFIEEFFEIILRAGGIDYFFYTPRNLFIISPRKESYGHIFDKIILNFTSMAGIRLFIESSKMYREDFGEIYALIPPNFYELRQQQKYIELNTIIKKRALAFLILCFVIRKVPNLININNMDIMVTEFQIKSQIKKSTNIIQKVIRLFEKKIKQAEKETGTHLQSFFTQIFVTPYQSQEAFLPTWSQIYVQLFEYNSMARLRKQQLLSSAQLSHAHAYFQKMLIGLWSHETNKSYFLERQYASDWRNIQQPQGNNNLDDHNIQQRLSIQAKEKQKNSQQMLYFLTKFNCNFHRTLQYQDPCILILTEQFSEDANQVILKLMQAFNRQTDTVLSQIEKAKTQKIEEVQFHKKPLEGQSNIEIQPPVEKELCQYEDQKNYQLYNPFLVKSKQQIQEVKRQLEENSQSNLSKRCQNQDKNKKSEFSSKIQDAPSFLRCAYSLRSLDKQASNKEIISLTNKQIVLTDLCSSLWKC